MKPSANAPPSRLLAAEAERRDRLREALRRAVLMDFVVSKEDAEGRGRFAVRRTDVYRSVAEKLRIRLISVQLAQAVTSVVEGLGGIPIKVGNRALFRGVQRRDICPAQAGIEAKRLRESAIGEPGSGGRPGREGGGGVDYMALLESEGMPEELTEVRMVDAKRAVINSARIAKATDVYWVLDAEVSVVRLAMMGRSIREIEEQTGIKRHAVHRILHRHQLTGAAGEDV